MVRMAGFCLYLHAMITRTIAHKLKQLLHEFPVVALLGPRQVGKTTLIGAIPTIKKKSILYLDLERPADLKKLDDLELFFSAHRNYFVKIDEVQNLPQIFSYLRHEVDALRTPGRFLLTGSAAPELVKGVSESLAGRIYYLEMFPIGLLEAVQGGYSMQRHWLRGGFPAALTARSNAVSMRWRESFVRSYSERDLSMLFGVAVSAPLVRNFWSMLALTHGAVYNSNSFARALGISAPTVARYLDLLEGAYLVRRLPAWYVNAGKRLVKAPKLYIRDSGVLHYFCGIEKTEDLPGNPIVGASWEGYVIEEVCRQLPPNLQAYYYRTHQGSEVDLLLVRGLKPVCAIEVKYSLQPSLTKGFYEALRDLGQPAAYVITPDNSKREGVKGINFIGLKLFLQTELQKIK